MVLEKTLESPLDCKEIKPVNSKGNQLWIFIGRTDAEAETLWPPDVKNWLLRKDPNAGKDWRQEEKWSTEDEMVSWHHQLNGHEFEQAPGVGDGQGGLVCCRPWGHKELNTTEQLNWTELNWSSKLDLLIHEVYFQSNLGCYLGCVDFSSSNQCMEEEESLLKGHLEWIPQAATTPCPFFFGVFIPKFSFSASYDPETILP